MKCNVRLNTKNHLLKKGLVDINMFITNPMFYQENRQLSDLARRKYGVTNSGNLYTWKNVGDKNVKAVENEEMFNELQQNHERFHSGRNDVMLQVSDSSIDFGIKSVNILQSPKGVQVFEKGKKAGWSLDKILTELQISKEQKQLILSFKKTDRDEIITELLSNYSYTIEINTAKTNKRIGNVLYTVDNVTSIGRDSNGGYFVTRTTPYGIEEEYITVEQAKSIAGEDNFNQYFFKKDFENTDYYSYLSVPGGTNYTENEIATPSIIPSIKGHAQFATDKGIGWFRSDEKLSEKATIIPSTEGKKARKFYEGSKTRRILEVQSDLFQKGRDLENLYLLKGEQKTLSQKKENKFLQLLNKDNNWVTFFVKSIIQDSAKKGYEKVLFPTGNTASKVEGHSTLEEFKKQKEDRIKFLEKEKYVVSYTTESGINNFKYFETLEEANSFNAKNKSEPEIAENNQNEINQLKQELERVDKEGFGALRPIYNFYENTVANILKKQGYQPKIITDEYGNTWQEIDVKPDRDISTIYLQEQNKGSVTPSKASPKTVAKLKELLNKIGFQYNQTSMIVDENGQLINASGIVDFAKQLIEVVNGYEDVALSEETMHLAVRILEQTNPKLYKQMLNKIGDYEIYSRVFERYKSIPFYQNEDGTPNIKKLKEEAIGKLLAEMYVTKEEGKSEKPENLALVQSWWRDVIEWFKQLFSKVDTNPFLEALNVIDEETFGTEEYNAERMAEIGAMAQLSDKEKKENFNVNEFIRNLLFIDSKLTLVQDPKKPNDPDAKLYSLDGKTLPKRVTDKIKERIKDYNPTEWDEFKRKRGTGGHADIQDIFKRYVDQNGYLRPDPLPQTLISELEPTDNKFYKALEANLVERLNSYPSGTRFFSEIKIYNGKDTAGTVDFMAITPEAQVDMLDWKFVEVPMGDTSIKNYKVESYQIQMGEYKNMLSSTYGIPKSNFRNTAMIPIHVIYNKKKKLLYEVRIGKVNVKAEENPVLLPIMDAEYSTGNKRIDSLIDKLNAVVKRFINTYKNEQDKSRLNEIVDRYYSAIRQVQTQGKLKALLQQTNATIKEFQTELERYKHIIENPETNEKALAQVLIQKRDILSVFADYNKSFNAFIKGLDDLSDKDKEALFAAVNNTASKADVLQEEYSNIIDKAVDKIAQDKDVLNIRREERPVNFRDRMVRSFSRAQTRTTKLFYRLYEEARQAAAFAVDEKINNLLPLDQKLNEIAKQKGLTTVQLFEKYLLKNHEVKDAKGKVLRTEVRLIDRHDKDIRAQLTKLLSNQDVKAAKEFVAEYVNIEAYQKDYEERKKEVFAKIDSYIYHENESDNLVERARRKREYEERYDLSKPTAYTSANARLAYHLNEKAASKEFKTLKSIPELYDLWKQIVETNKLAASRDVGIIKWSQIYTFVPNVRKSFADRLFNDKSVNPFKTILESVSVDPEADNVFGAIDPITRKPIDKIPANFVYELDEKEKSKEILRSLALWQKEIEEYKMKSELESHAKLLMDVESRKETLNANNEVVPKGNDDPNTKYLENFINYYVYNKRLVGKGEDLSLTIDMKKTAEAVNKALGFKILSENYAEGEEKVTVSATKAVQAANRFLQMKVLGLNLTTAFSNLFGGNANAIINSGKYFTRGEYLKYAGTLPGIMKAGEGELYARLIDYFMPLVENQSNVKIDKLNSTKLAEVMTSEILFVLQRGSDKMVTYPMLLAMLENTTVIDGKLVNINEYVREQKGYLATFKMPEEDRKRIRAEIDQEIAKMKEKSILKTAKIVDGSLVIDGINRNDRSVGELRSKIQKLGRDVLGSASPEDIAQYRMTLLGQTFMMFKNWIPNLALVRFGGLKENATGDWEYGRLRLMYKLIADNGLRSYKTLKDVLELNQDGINYMSQLYQKKLDEFVEKNNDAEEFLSEEEFMEIYTRGLQMAVTETKFWLSMAGIVTGGVYAIDTDDPDDQTRGLKKFALRALDKALDELGFFFSPKSFTDIANGNIFPALGTVTDGMKFFSQWGKQSTGFLFGIEEWEEEAKPMKYMFKTMPITKEMLTYIAIFNDDLARDMGIRISNQYSVR